MIAIIGMGNLPFWDKVAKVNYSGFAPLSFSLGILLICGFLSEKNQKRKDALKEQIEAEKGDINVIDVSLYSTALVMLEVKTSKGTYREGLKPHEAVEKYLDTLAKINDQEVPSWILEGIKQSCD